MAGIKFLVLYPRPTNIEAFEKLYQEQHVPMAREKLAGKTKFVATKVLASPSRYATSLPCGRDSLHPKKPCGPRINLTFRWMNFPAD